MQFFKLEGKRNMNFQKQKLTAQSYIIEEK